MGELLGAEVFEPESSTSIVTICRPGTIARPSILKIEENISHSQNSFFNISIQHFIH